MFKLTDLMRLVEAPEWRLDEEDYYPKKLVEEAGNLHWTVQEGKTLPAFFNYPFPVVNVGLLQFLLSHAGDRFEYQGIEISGLPAGEYYRLYFKDAAEGQDKKIWIDTHKDYSWFCISAKLKKSLEQTDLKGLEWSPTCVYKKEQSYYDYLFQHLRKAHEDNDLDTLIEIVEWARGGGFFYSYADFEENEGLFFNLFLQIAIDLVQTKAAFESERLWFFITEVYDIRFHQIPLDEYPAETYRLYFELTQKVLQPHFHALELDKDRRISGYGRTLYFIKMACGWFEDIPEDFFALYPLILPLCNDPEYHLDAYWLDSYKELTAL
jgi:hypothetical protein